VLEDIEGIKVHRSERAYPSMITTEGFRSINSVLRFTAWSFSELRKDGPFDVIEANHCPIFPALSSWVGSRLGGTPLCVTFHEVWYNEWYRYVPRRVYAPVGIGLEHATTLVPDMAIAVSEMTARGLMEHFGMRRQKIKIISNGVDLEMFNSIDVGRDDSKVVFVGRLNPHKRLDWLLAALELLTKTHPKLKLSVVGDGPWAQRYRSMGETSVLDGRVSFLGALEDEGVARELKSSMVYVQPSMREGQSITVLEAMAAGTPQVAVRTTGSAVADLLATSESGMAVPPSPRSIAAGIEKLLDDESLWRRLSSNSLGFVKSFSWDSIAEQHLVAYSEMVSRRREG